MKIEYNSRYTKRHLSIRVPWHDNKWDGTVCKSVKNNNACLILKNCAESRDDKTEEEFSGKRICDIRDESKLPPCISESGMFMSSFDFQKKIKHPYANDYNEYYKHIKPTPVTFPKFSAPAIPFRWGMPEFAKLYAHEYDLDYNSYREPFEKTQDFNLKFTTNWVQDYLNQKALFDCFFEHVSPMESMALFYAKEVPFIEDNNRVLIGIGEIKSIIQQSPFITSNESGFKSMPWEHMVNHSIRPGSKEGFLFPYHEALEYQKNHPNFDPKSIAVIIPNEFREAFSYKTEHVSHDFAIYILRESIKKIGLAKDLGIGENWNEILDYLTKKLAQIIELRGDYPGFGVALKTLGIERGHFLAQHIFNTISKDECPWEYLDKIFSNLKILPENLKGLISIENIEIWNLFKRSKKNRLSLLQLFSRFNFKESESVNLFDPKKRAKFYKDISDSEIISDPYVLYEISIHSKEPINYSVIDSGLMLNRNQNLKPTELKEFTPLSKERIRALSIMELEKQSLKGHTLFPEDELITNIANLPIEPECNLDEDYFNLASSIFQNHITTQYTADNKKAYQLERYNQTGQLINSVISKRLNAKQHNLNLNWESYLTQIDFKDTEVDKKAKQEKIKGLEVLANSRFSVLIGQAGSGKTTLLSALASIPKIKLGNVLFLAPTGKARVRMEQQAKKHGVTAKTIASFLFKSGRFNGATQTYHLNDSDKEMGYKTVIIDECSMLTEEMLAATLQHLKRVERLILVGDYRQLPPIGAGRPFFDIINFIKPKNIENIFPKIGNSYVELTTSARQVQEDNSRRFDTDFANLFGGNIKNLNADEVIEKVLENQSQNIQVYSWENESDFQECLSDVLEKELSIKDENSFNRSIGANDHGFFNWNQAVKKVEDWQILSPVKSKVFGTQQLNRSLHEKYKNKALMGALRGKVTPNPLGLEKIIYGDKVINLINGKREKGTYPENGINYLANGEIGIAVGRTNWKNKSKKYKPYQLEVEFTSQEGFKYQFTSKDFDDENGSFLELAYALTIHKAQGSEFKTVILAIPEPCVLLSRELLYTALTRQVDKVILLYQGNPQYLFNYTGDNYSSNLQRITNLFYKPNISKHQDLLFEKNLIHCASNGKFLRSKSEVIIYELLLKNGLEPEYEYKLELNGQVKRPDFFIVDDDLGIEYYWEHLGMLNDSNYSKNWNEKLNWYKSNRILPYNEGGGENGTLIITKDNPNGSISAKEISDIIEEIFEVKSTEKTFDEINELTKEIFELRNTVLSFISGVEQKFKDLKASNVESEDKISEIYKLLDESSRKSNLQSSFNDAKDAIFLFEKLEDKSKTFLSSSFFLKEQLIKSNAKDFSPFILQFCRVFENELLNKLFLTFYAPLRKILENEPDFLDKELNNSKSSLFAKSLKKKSEDFTLGTMAFILEFIKSENGKTFKSSELLQKFREHAITVVNLDFFNPEFLLKLNELTRDFRNKAAHVNEIPLSMANEFFEFGVKTMNDFLNKFK